MTTELIYNCKLSHKQAQFDGIPVEKIVSWHLAYPRSLCNAVVMREEALSLVYYMMFFSYLFNILTAGPGDPAAPAGPCIPIDPWGPGGPGGPRSNEVRSSLDAEIISLLCTVCISLSGVGCLQSYILK